MHSLLPTRPSTKTADVQKKWVLIDADGLVLGRLATIIATRLRGKHLPTYTPARRLRRQHRRDQRREGARSPAARPSDKIFYWHTGSSRRHQGARPWASASRASFPERVVEKAVERMITARPAGRAADEEPARLQGRRAPARGAAAREARHRRDEPQELEDRLTWHRTFAVADLQKSPRRASRLPRRQSRVKEIDAQGRAYATGQRKNAVARVWIKPGTGKITINGRTRRSTSRARPSA